MGSEQWDIWLNHQSVTWKKSPTTALLDVIRAQPGLTGTKVGCRTGECGACTVLDEGQPVLSCLLPIAAVEGHAITTIEGLAETKGFQLLEDAMVEQGGVQCGFCTPGMVVALAAWVQAMDDPRPLAAALKNNLCRCTGYQGILIAGEHAKRRLMATETEKDGYARA